MFSQKNTKYHTKWLQRFVESIRVMVGLCFSWLLLVGFTSCKTTQEVYMEEVDPTGWHSGEEVVVRVENQDTVSMYTVSVMVGVDADFEYDRLRLSLTTVTPEGFPWCDTVTVLLPKERKRGGLTMEFTQPYREHVQWGIKGAYRFVIRPLMPVEEVKGVMSVGVRMGKEK